MSMIFQHKFEEGKYVIEGEIVLVDVDTREVMVAKKGDMLHLPHRFECHLLDAILCKGLFLQRV